MTFKHFSNRFIHSFIAILLLISAGATQAQNTPAFIEASDIALVTDPMDLQRIANLTANPDVLDFSIVNIGYLPDIVDGLHLQFSLPGEDFIYDFLAKNVIYKEVEDTYHWLGKNLDTDNTISIVRTTAGRTRGFIVDVANNYYYDIVDLADNRALLIKYTFDHLSSNTCGTANDLPNDYEDEEDEYEEDTYGYQQNGGNDVTMGRDVCGSRTVRVLVVFTTPANVSGNPVSVAEDIIMQANTATDMSALTSGLNFELTGVENLPGFVETQNPETDIENLANSSTAFELRDEHLADVVLLLVAPLYPNTGGIVKAIKAKNNSAFAIATITAATDGNFTAVHELGHLLGARYQRCRDCDANCDGKITYAHGNVIEENAPPNVSPRKTLMGTIPCDGVRRLIWSNPDVDIFPGVPSGANSRDNARMVDKHGRRVACFRDSPPVVSPENNLTVGIVGPVLLDNLDNTYTYHSTISPNGVGPFTYVWEVSDNGFEFELVSSDQNYFIENIDEIPDGNFILRLKVFDSATQTGSTTFNGHKLSGFGSPVISKVQEENILDFIAKNNFNPQLFNQTELPQIEEQLEKDLSVFPNPAANELTVTVQGKAYAAEIKNVEGKIVLRQQIDGQKKFAITTAQLNSGIYYISVNCGESSFTQKFIKL